MRQSRQSFGVLAVIALLLVLLAVGVARLTPTLIPSLGLLVLGGGLVLAPRWTALAGGIAVGLAVVLVIAEDLDRPLVRVANVVLASALAVTASWALDRRIRRIEALSGTQAAVLASIPDGVVVLDHDGVVLRLNEALQGLVPRAEVGLALHPLLGHTSETGDPCPGGCALAGVAPQGWSGSTGGGRIAPEAGRPVPIEFRAAPVPNGGLVVSVRDTSVREAAEADRRALVETASRQQEQARLLAALSSPERSTLATLDGFDMELATTSTREGQLPGGDVVDASLLEEGCALLLMVDAGGSGVESLRDAWKVLFVARAHLQAGVPLAEVVARTAQTLAGDASPPAGSLIAATVDTDTGAVSVAAGGHPPALVVRSDGRTEWLDSVGRELGSADPRSTSVASATLGSDDALVLYSDGVLDCAGDILVGLASLRASAAALLPQRRGDAQALLRAVVPEGCSDATVLVARIRPRAGGSA